MNVLDAEKAKTLGQPMEGTPTESQIKPELNSLASFSSYSGPIPPPNHLAQYEKMIPGIAKRFLEEPRLEAEQRRALENKMVDAQINLGNRGQVMACILASTCVVGSFAAIFSGHSL